jgi:hypothetical protein
MDVDFAVTCPLVRPGLPHIRFLFVRSRFCSTLLSDPASRRRPCASLALHLHQVVQGTCTPQLSNMLGTHGDRGEPRGSSPPTPPGIRVRTTAVRSSSAVGGVTAGRRALGVSLRQGRFGPFMISIRGFTPTLRHEGQSLLDFRPHVTHESRVRLTLPIVRAFDRSFPVVRALAISPLSGECPARADRRLRPTMPSADSCATVGEPHGSLSPSATDVGSGHDAGLPR